MTTESNGNSAVGKHVMGFRERLRELIGSDSIRSFSRKSGISEGTIRGYLEGRNMPTLEKLIALAKAGDKSVEWLAEGKTSITTKLKPTTMKTAELIEGLSEENQREILLRINALHKADRQEIEIRELKEMVKALLEKVS